MKGAETKNEALVTDQASEKEQIGNREDAKESEAAGAGESTDSGISGEVLGSNVTVADLPEVPATEPSTGDEPASKRQKPSSDS